MGKRRNRTRRRHETEPRLTDIEAIVHEKTAPVLRLVQPKGVDVPGEPDAAGQPDPTIRDIPKSSGCAADGAEATYGNHVVAAADDRIDGLSEPIVTRSFDAADINPIINHPEILPSITVPGIDHLDAAPLLADPRNVLLMAEGGGVLFCQIEPGIYEVHTNFLPEHRGRNAIRSSLAAYRWMFTHSDCMVLHTRVPAFNEAAEKFCGIVGATKEFERKSAWPTKDGAVDLSFWSLRYDDWARDAKCLIESGQDFHAQLNEERRRHGYNPEQAAHPDDECHDRYVGACAEMVYGGQPEKAVALYNRWARFAGYGLITLVSRSPVVIDIGDALLQIGDGTFKAVLCRK